MKKALVCGAGGFIGSHLVRRLKADGFWVRGVGSSCPKFSSSHADDFLLLDLRDRANCEKALTLTGEPFDEVYQLAADMGGIGYITTAECDILRNNSLININMVHAAAESGVKRYLYSSSVCVYRDMASGETEMTEEEVYPAAPDNEYGWEKLFSERVVAAYGRKYPMTVRIARLQSVYGPEDPWQGGREKAPAALCRKAAQVAGDGTIEVWGDGSAIRSYLFIDDMVSALRRLMEFDIEYPVNIGSSEYVSVGKLVSLVREASGKNFAVRYVPGPVGVQSRNFSNNRIYSTGWKPTVSLREGIKKTYQWIAEQLRKQESAPDTRVVAFSRPK